MKKTISLFLAFFLFFTGTVSAAFSDTREYLLSHVPDPTVSSVGGEWTVIALAKCGEPVPEEYFLRYQNNLLTVLTEKDGILHARKYTEYARAVLALSAIGQDPQSFGGYNLLLPLADYDKTVLQGVNGAIWALIALDSGGYELPQLDDPTHQASRKRYLEKILSSQFSDGGWGFSDTSDPDLTAMALFALSPYQNQEQVQTAIQAGLSYLSETQNADGGFSVLGGESAESCAQVLAALSALRISLSDERFQKNGHTVMDALLSYENANGSYSHTKGGAENLMATEQAFYALSLNRAIKPESPWKSIHTILKAMIILGVYL